MEIISRRAHTFYLTLFFLNLFFVGFALLFFLFREIKNGDFVGLIFVIMVIFFDYHYIKNCPTVSVNKNGINIGNKYFKWEEVSEIKMTGKGSGFIFGYMEATRLSFQNLNTVYIYDDFYQNASEIKSFINTVVINKDEFLTLKQIKPNKKDISFENLVAFKGHPVFSFRGIMIWGFVLAFIIMHLYYIKNIGIKSLILLSGLILFWLLLNFWMTYYFSASKNIFVVRNHYFFWIQKIYNLDDIEEIVYEQQGKQANSLRLITKDFKSKKFMAGTLNNKKWLEMKTFLEEKNIKVRNECIY